MVYAPELQSIVEAAERAAAAEDFVSAERLLRQAAVVQESQVGPMHPDLANTLNNLGIICERTGKLDDAEASYLRAYTIATSALGPDHPLTVTSGQNLREFCEARGAPINPPAASPDLVDFGPEVAATPQEVASTATRESMPVIRPATPRRGATGVVIGIVAVGALGLVGYLATRDDPRPAVNEVSAPPVAVAPPPAPAPAPSPEPEPAPAPPAALPAPSPATPTARAVEPAAVPTPQGAASVVDAQLCREFSPRDWRCTPADNPVAPGALTYFTRLTSRTDTTVQHRWYFEGALLRTVSLRIRANQSAGFRTYSRNTVTAERAGDWRIELRGADGALLSEVRFVVR